MRGLDSLPGIDEDHSTRRNLLVGGGYALGGLVTVGAVATSVDDGDTGGPGAGTETPTPGVTSEPTETQTASGIVGQPIDAEGARLIVTEASRTDSVRGAGEPEAGNTFVVVGLALKNTTEKRYPSLGGFLRAELRDGQGRTYSPVLEATDSELKDGQLAPGEVSRGDVVFEVVRDAADLRLSLDVSAFDGIGVDRVVVDLTKRTEGAELEQTLRVSVNELGDTVRLNGVDVAVFDAEFRSAIGSVTAPEGREFAVVDVSTANETNDVFSFSAPVQMESKGGDGRSFPYAPTATGELPDGYDGEEVGPGGWIRGDVAFEVAEGVAPLYYIFRFSVVSGGPRTFWRLR